MHSFKDGQKVEQVWWSCGTIGTYYHGSPVDSIVISMEPGHLANIPFVKATYFDGHVMMECVTNCRVLLAKNNVE